jgi:ATP/ADP translocase
MREVTCRLFSLTRGEEIKVLLFALTGFLWSLAASIAFKFADVLFIFHVGSSSLPTIYICIPCGMMLLFGILFKIYQKVPAHKVFLTLICCSAGINGTTYFFYQFFEGVHPDWFWYFLRIQTALLFYPLIAAYWTFVDQYFTPHDARRLFGMFSSMVFLGATTTGAIMRWGLISKEFLAPFILIVMACAVLTTRLIVKKLKEHQVEIRDTSEPLLPLLSKIKTIFSSKYTLLLISGNFMAIFMWVIAEYNYMSTFELKFAVEGEAELRSFLGECLSIVSIVNVIFGVFMYAHLVRKFGVETIILITPLMYLLMFSGWLYFDLFMFPLMGYFIVEGSSEIIDNSNFSLLIRGIPGPLKPTFRVMINSIFEPMGMLMGGIVLSLMSFDSRILGFIIACSAVTGAFSLRYHHIKVLPQFTPKWIQNWASRFRERPAIERS